jgi:hypothetical protein
VLTGGSDECISCCYAGEDVEVGHLSQWGLLTCLIAPVRELRRPAETT